MARGWGNRWGLGIGVTLSLLATACSPQHNHKLPSGLADAGQIRPLNDGNLVDEVKRIYDPKKWNLSAPCDVPNGTKLLQIAQELEKRRLRINEINDAAIPSENMLKWGPYHFSGIDGTRGQSPDTWKTEKSAWAPVFKFFDNIKEMPTNEKWTELNWYVRSMIVDDENRLIFDANMMVNRDQQPIVERTLVKFEVCQQESTCVSVDLTPRQLDYINAGGGTKKYYDAFKSRSASLDDRRAALKKLIEWIGYDSERYAFLPYKKASVTQNTIHVPMNTAVFGRDAYKFKEFVESIWNIDSEMKIDIELFDNSVTDIVKVLVGAVGGRAYVSREENLMMLYDYDTAVTSAHEFGHVIGFKDYYYTTFNPQSCEYTIEYNERDIMSAGDMVLPTHWDMLKANY